MSHRNLAFFGATGGCANACLAHSLLNGHRAIALARSPQRLREQLEMRKVSSSVVAEQLHIVQGDVKDVKAVGEVLRFGGRGVDTVISGIGISASAWTLHVLH